MQSSTPRVAVLVDTATGWGRRVVRGILSHARRHGPWHLWIESHGQEERLRLPPGWVGDGIIARVATPAIAREVRAAGVPVVNVSGIELAGATFPRVTTDLYAAGQLAARYFLDRGFRQFAYCQPRHLSYVQRHRRGFADTLHQAGCPCLTYRPPASPDWRHRQAHLSRWLAQLPKPVGIFTWADQIGRQVLDACWWAKLPVPEQVAVLAGDDDDLLNEGARPPLSAITTPAERIGHDAAELLDRLIRRPRALQKPLRIEMEPTGIITRQSTDTLAITDIDLAAAIRFIRDHAADPIQLADVLRAVPISRRTLERRFEQVLGRSPAAEIRRVHLQRAQELLVETDMPIPRVAAASGFGSPEYLAHIFRRQTGLTPLKYRTQSRGR